MKTFETEKGNIPEGATHYRDECKDFTFVWVKQIAGKEYVWDADSWYEAVVINRELEIKPIPQTSIETPEEKEALDLIDTTPHQHESVVSKKAEWNSGDKCIYNGDEFLFVGMIPTLNDFSCVIFSDTHGAKRATTIELSKPETEAERVEREELEVAYDLYCDHDSDCGFKDALPFDRFVNSLHRIAWINLVRKTKCLKGVRL